MNDRTLEHEGRVIVDGVDALIVAGWTGRDAAAVAHHVRELEAIGVAPPSSVPLFYRVSASLLTTRAAIDVVGEESSGEVEPLIVLAAGRRWLGVASDHTDRALEAHSVALSKQICAKPCAPELWAFDELADRLDTLELRSWITDHAAFAADPTGADEATWTLYQEGTLAAIRPLEALLEISPLGVLGQRNGSSGDASSSSSGSSSTGEASGEASVEESGEASGDATVEASDGTVARSPAAMLCGTLPAIGGVRAADAFRIELHDPTTGRRLRHAYAVRTLPEIA